MFTKISQQIPIWNIRKTIYMLTYICMYVCMYVCVNGLFNGQRVQSLWGRIWDWRNRWNKITEPVFVLCKVWAEAKEIVGDQNVKIKHDGHLFTWAMEKTYSNSNRANAPEVLRPAKISSLFYLQNILLFHNIGIYIHRLFTYFMKVTPSIYQLRITIQYTSSHPPTHL